MVKNFLEITGFFDYVSKSPLNKEEFIEAIKLAPTIKENFYTALSVSGNVKKAINFVNTDELMLKTLK